MGLMMMMMRVAWGSYYAPRAKGSRTLGNRGWNTPGLWEGMKKGKAVSTQ